MFGEGVRQDSGKFELGEVVSICDHLGKLKFSRTLPYAFTEHGAIKASNVLASPQAVEMGIYVGAARAHHPARTTETPDRFVPPEDTSPRSPKARKKADRV